MTDNDVRMFELIGAVIGVWAVVGVHVFAVASWRGWSGDGDGPGAVAFMWPMFVLVGVVFIIPAKLAAWAQTRIEAFRDGRRRKPAPLPLSSKAVVSYREDLRSRCPTCGTADPEDSR